MGEVQGWLARQDSAAVTKALAELDRKEIAEHDGDAGYVLFMRLVDQWVMRAVGLSVHDLADFDSRSAYEDGDSPTAAALAVLSAEGAF